MTRIFVYEFITGGGSLDAGAAISDSLKREGLAMLTSLAADLSRVPGVEVTYLKDARLDDLLLPGCREQSVQAGEDAANQFSRCAAEADWSVIIAPEFDSILLDRCRAVEAAGGRLLGPSCEVVALAADKQRTAEHLSAAGVSVPEGVPVEPGDPLPHDFSYPAIMKPRFGAGSHEVYLIPARSKAKDFRAKKWVSIPRRLERYCPGTPASVATLCGPGGNVCLPPCRQLLSDDGRFRYRGGSLPLRDDLVDRATSLASRAIASLPFPLGYIGIDMVLGEDSAGDGDVVIEVNPRLTTSYVGLCAAARQNLAGAMLDIAAGRSAALEFKPDALHFWADGRVERA